MLSFQRSYGVIWLNNKLDLIKFFGIQRGKLILSKNESRKITYTFMKL